MTGRLSHPFRSTTRPKSLLLTTNDLSKSRLQTKPSTLQNPLQCRVLKILPTPYRSQYCTKFRVATHEMTRIGTASFQARIHGSARMIRSCKAAPSRGNDRRRCGARVPDGKAWSDLVEWNGPHRRGTPPRTIGASSSDIFGQYRPFRMSSSDIFPGPCHGYTD